MGDFNEVMKAEECKGGSSLSCTSKEFGSWFADMELLDLPIVGKKFTWFRGNLCSKIERVLVEFQWLEMFNNLKVLAAMI